MSVTDMIRQYIIQYIDWAAAFFSWYNAIGRQILDFFHSVFDSIFNVLLSIAIILSLLYFAMSIYILCRKKDRKKEDSYNGVLPFVTVQIPTFNELAAVRCAKHCLDFDYPKDRYEILIGDDSNDPEVSGKLKEFAGDNPRVRIIKRPSNIGFKPGNLNSMLKHSKGEFLVIFDSDFVPQADFLKKIMHPFMMDK